MIRTLMEDVAELAALGTFVAMVVVWAGVLAPG